MKVRVWGSRGSIASPGPETARYGGNTSCLEVRSDAGHVLVLDGGTGARRLGETLTASVEPLHIMLSHLHIDHIQGLGFFAPLFQAGREVHIWGPASTARDHRRRLVRYLSPPLFPVWLDDLPCHLHVHDFPASEWEIPGFTLTTQMVCHPGPTFAVRVEADGVSMVYIPDHEPALLRCCFPHRPEWVSGSAIANGADLLVHDAQFLDADYDERIGWGHSSLSHVVDFAKITMPRSLMPFHYAPGYDDATLDTAMRFLADGLPDLSVVPARENSVHIVGSDSDLASSRHLVSFDPDP